MKKDLIVKYGQFKKEKLDNKKEVQFEQFVSFFTLEGIKKHFFRYSTLIFLCKEFEQISRPFLTMVMCRLMTFGECIWQNQRGEIRKIDIETIVSQFIIFIKEHLTYKRDLQRHFNSVEKLYEINSKSIIDELNLFSLFLRENLPVGLISGGSISHAIGVINNLEKCTNNKTVVVTIEHLPNIEKNAIVHNVNSEIKFRNVKDFMSIAVNDIFYETINKVMEGKKCQFIYQRCSINAYAGIKYALEYNIPFVLEYNSSEVWTSKQWGGNKLNFIDFSEKVEKLLLEKSDLITCVSKPLKQQLIEQGVDESKIIVTPNGVDIEKYNPELSGEFIRKEYNIDKEKIVIGFIGTFGKWHGAEVLTKAFAQLVKKQGYRKKVHLMLIGNGIRMPLVKKIIEDNDIKDLCTLTGSVPQEEGAYYLAACDILVSPTVKNPDGTPFFGSPTKLFEYMAMGKAIIASNMDQMAEIFTNRKNAILCQPGSAEELVEGMIILIDNGNLREKIGICARELVCEKYSWEKHTHHIVQALRGRLNG